MPSTEKRTKRKGAVRASFLQYYEHLEREFHLLYNELLEQITRQRVHDLRVNIKQQMAFFQLLKYLDEHFQGQEAVLAFRPLFKVAGKLRNVEIEKSLLETEENLIAGSHYFSAGLAAEESYGRVALETFETEHSLVKIREVASMVRSALAPLSAGLLRQQSHAYFADLLERVKKKAKESRKRRKPLHELRKLVKELFYNLRAIDPAFPGVAIPRDVYEGLKGLQSLLGEWHDYDYTLKKIGRKRKTPAKLKEQLVRDRGLYEQRIREYLRRLPPLLNSMEEAIGAMLMPGQ